MNARALLFLTLGNSLLLAAIVRAPSWSIYIIKNSRRGSACQRNVCVKSDSPAIFLNASYYIVFSNLKLKAVVQRAWPQTQQPGCRGVRFRCSLIETGFYYSSRKHAHAREKPSRLRCLKQNPLFMMQHTSFSMPGLHLSQDFCRKKIHDAAMSQKEMRRRMIR